MDTSKTDDGYLQEVANEPSERRAKSTRPWLSVLVSLLVPGFGLVRAGRPLRGLAWFAGLQILAVAVALLTIWRAVPTALAACAWVAAAGVQLAMLVDSYRPGGLRPWLWVGFAVAFAAFVFMPLPANFVARAFKVPTGAMTPTLIGGAGVTPDHIVADRVSLRFSEPQRGDLVVFQTDGLPRVPPGAFYVKRVVGLPNETIMIKEGRLFVDGRQLDETDEVPPSVDYFNHPSTDEPGFHIPAGSYFVLGDNSAHSYDSRYWGAVPHENIYGRVARIYYPFSRAGVPR